MVEVPDSTTRYIQNDSGKPTKDLFNWMRGISQQLASILSGIGGGLFSSGLPSFSVHKNGTDQTGVTSATFTLVTWSTEIYDVGSYFVSNAWTPPAGKVAVCAGAIYSGTITAGSQTGIAIFKNGSLFKQTLEGAITNAAAGMINIEDIANGSDAYSVQAFVTTSAGTATVQGNSANTFFMGHWFSP